MTVKMMETIVTVASTSDTLYTDEIETILNEIGKDSGGMEGTDDLKLLFREEGSEQQ